MKAPEGYVAQQNPDGTWDILDVPIFSETALETLEGDGVAFNEEWLEEAVRWHLWKFSEDGFRVPLNERHNSDHRGKSHAGRLLPHRVDSFHFDGADHMTVFAHLQRIPEWVYQRIKSGEIEYVSVECNDVRKPRFAACALMSDTLPHHKYPPIRIKEERVRGRTFTPVDAHGAPLAGDVPLALVASSENPLRRADAMKKKAKSYNAIQDDPHGRYIVEFGDGRIEYSDKEGLKGYEFDDDAEPEKKGEELDEQGGSTVKSLCSQIEKGEISVADMDAIEAAIAARKTEADGEGEETGDQPAEPMAMSELAKKAIEANERAGRAEQTTLKIKKDLDKKACFEKARNDLTGHAFQESELEEAYEFHQVKGVEYFVSQRKKYGRRVPIDPEDATPETVAADDIPKDYEFSGDSKVFAKEFAASQEYDHPEAAGIRSKFTRKQWIHARTRTVRELTAAGGDK